MIEPRRLHPLAMVFTFLKLLRAAIIPLITFAFSFFKGFGGFSPLIWAAAVIAFILFFILPSFLSWYRFTYRVEDGELKIEHGSFVKNHRYIRKERIQSVDRTTNVLHRPFGLVKVQIETSGGSAKKGPEAELSAISLQEAQRLEKALYGKTETEEPENQDPGPGARSKVNLHHLLIAGATSGKIGVVLSAIGAILSQVDNWLPESFYTNVFHKVLASGIEILAILILAAALIAWILAMLGTVIKYANFTLARTGDELEITYGLLESKHLIFSLNRIQAIRIVEGLLRQPFGFVSLYVESTGGNGGKGEDFSTLLFPILPKKKVAAFLNEFVPSYPVAFDWVPAPKRALWHYGLRLLIPALLIAVPVVIWAPFGVYAWLLLPLALILGIMQYRGAGWSVSGAFRALRFRKLNRTTVIVPRKNIQDREVRQSYFQRKSDLATYRVAIASRAAGKRFRVDHIESDICRALLGENVDSSLNKGMSIWREES